MLTGDRLKERCMVSLRAVGATTTESWLRVSTGRLAVGDRCLILAASRVGNRSVNTVSANWPDVAHSAARLS